MRPIFSRQYRDKGVSNQINSSNSISFSSTSSQSNKQAVTPINNRVSTPSKDLFRRYKAFFTTMLVISYIRKLKKSIKKRKFRQNLVKQWLTTQQSYNSDLNTTLIHIKRPMEQAKLIDRDQSQIMFPEIQGMIQLSNMMIETIKKAKKVNSKSPYKFIICDQINKFVGGYKLYGTYFGCHLKAAKLLAYLAQTRQAQLKQIQTNMQQQLTKKQSKKANMSINDCMQQPLYRLSKYVLLLKQYQKKLPLYHPDYKSACKCHLAFHQINNHGNDLMKNLQDQQRKIKLDKLFGEVLKENRTLLQQMQASTIYFQAKLYIFNDIVIITKVQTLLGSVKQEKYGTFQLNQFSYVAEQPDLKYFENILILISRSHCIHLFFPDEGSRAQLYKCMIKNLRQLQVKQAERRRFGQSNKGSKTKKLSFTLQQQRQSQFLLQPQFRVQIVGFQVRPLSTLSNDTVYQARFMIPFYLQDQTNFLGSKQIALRNRQSNDNFKQTQNFKVDSYKPNQRAKSLPFNYQKLIDQLSDKKIRETQFKCINQKIQIHFSVLQQIHKLMKNICPNELPDIDPITKDVNVYSKGKRKTKSYEMRKFFIQQFLNFIFRHQTIMSNPIWFISKLRINQALWNYSTSRNSQLKRFSKQNEKSYGYQHCQICKRAQINSIQEFQHYRSYYNSDPSHRNSKSSDRYCFNFYNLMRIRLLYFKSTCFDSLERILLFYNILQGRLDYPFLMHNCKDETVKAIRIYLPSLDENYVTVLIDTKSTAGQVIDQLGNTFKMKSAFDFQLMATYNSKPRILDRDQFLSDIIKSLDIPFQQVSANGKKQSMSQKSEGSSIFSSLKTWGNSLFQSTDKQNRLYFIKITYLHKSLELKSFSKNPEKRSLQIQKVFWSIKKGIIKLSQRQFAQLCSLYYCLKQLDRIQYFSMAKLNIGLIQKIIPAQHINAFSSDPKLKNELGYYIQQQKQVLLKNGKNSSYINSKIIDRISQKVDYFTYYIQVQPRQVPQQVLAKDKVPNTLLIGVNYKNLIVTRSNIDKTAIATLAIADLQYSLSVFSLFIQYQSWNFRFDGKMLYHFGELIKKYRTIIKNFPQHNG